MANLDIRESLLTNGLGSFASGTVSDIRTRIYHGWLFTATNPPTERKLLLSHLEASLEISGRVVALGTNFWVDGQIKPQGYKFLQHFEVNPMPKWIWSGENWEVSRCLFMPNTTNINSRVFIQYAYKGINDAILRLRPLIADRNFHHQQQANPQLQFSQLLELKQVCLQAIIPKEWVGTPWYLRWSHGKYQPDGMWYWNYGLAEETQRGLQDSEDLYNPGYLSIYLQPNDKVFL